MAQTVLITGGSSGIGFELAKLFAKDGCRLILVSKPADELAEAKAALKKLYPDVQVTTIQKDLTAATAPEEVYAAVKTQGERVQVLVNNAGFGAFGFLADNDINAEYNSILLNCGALYKLTRLFLPDMIAQKQGRILNVASVAAFQPNPLLGVYGATKAFVLSMTRALRFEMREQKTGVTVTALCPPPTRTKFADVAGMQKISLFQHFDALDPATVALYGYKALHQGAEYVIPGAYLGFMYRLTHLLLPISWLMRFAYLKLNMKSG